MIYMVVDVNNNRLLAVFEEPGPAQLCSDNTPAHCVVYRCQTI